MKQTITLELSTSEIQTILSALQSQIHSDLEYLYVNNEAFNPAGESFQTFLSIINDMNEVYLKLSSAIEAENND